MNYKFNPEFKWGAASSGPQSEGVNVGDGKKQNIWDFWYEEEPSRFFESIGPDVTSDFYNKFKEYIPLLKQTGIKSYRTSIQWSRLFSDRDGTINPVGLNFYQNLINELIKNDIEPMLCLHHFDMPMYWMEKGGFENRDTVFAFAKYALKCFELFGDRVKYWTTFNEPIVIVEQGYFYKNHYPAICDAKKAVQVAVNIQLASSLAINEFHKGKFVGQIGIILNLSPTYCRDLENPKDVEAAEIADSIFNRSFLDSSVKGEFPKRLIELIEKEGVTPLVSDKDLEIIKNNRVDFLGVNYYQPRRVKAKESYYDKNVLTPEKFYDNYTFEGQKINIYRGWEVYEKGLYDIAINLRDNYGNISWYVSENGMGVENEERWINEDGNVEDNYRIEFISNHLKYLHKGIEEGSNCFGYHLWSPFDCWSWINAYKNRYGLIRVDIKNNCALSIKKSGRWFKKIVDNNGF